jgi:alpha 1,2-mannosyltransferase
MLINTPQCMGAVLRLGAFVLFLLTCSSYFLPRRYDSIPIFESPRTQSRNLTEAGSTFNSSVVEFWQDLATALIDATPQCKPLQVIDEPIQDPDDRFEPLKLDKKHPDRLVGFTDEDASALRRAHQVMRVSAQHLAPRIPFTKDTTGIVTTANSEYMPVLLVSLRMLRLTSCTLPVEVFIDDWTQYVPSTCEILLPSLNARCVVLSNVYATAPHAKKPDHYQYKILSILFSSFQHILFLDSDAFPIANPTPLFSTPPYTSHALVTWPDYFALTVSPHWYAVANTPVEPVSSRLSTESGQLLLNKAVHRESLLLMVYYNYFGPGYYYPLLCQGSHGAGDKETFVQAARATQLPWFQVRNKPGVLGRVWDGAFRGTGIVQAHAGLDWADLLGTKTVGGTQPLFVHQNMLKTDPERVLRDKGDITFEKDGSAHRMWGGKEDMERLLGFDVERRLWEVIEEEGCRIDEGGSGGMLARCLGDDGVLIWSFGAI